MNSLETRIERLEKSNRRWRVCFLVLMAASIAAAAKPAAPVDARFAHLTAESLTIRDKAAGPFAALTCDDAGAALKLASPASSTLVNILAGADNAQVSVSRGAAKGLSSASLSADSQSGFIDLHAADGKTRGVEPE